MPGPYFFIVQRGARFFPPVYSTRMRVSTPVSTHVDAFWGVGMQPAVACVSKRLTNRPWMVAVFPAPLSELP